VQALEKDTWGTRPTAEMLLVAVLSGSEYTSGTLTLPVDTVKFTPEPGNSMMPADGYWEITESAGAVLNTLDTIETA
jgi:hypothetical protein